jgi:predicted RNA-binding Zn-ribbon protein involved in translation (DUF1610 family)
MTSANQTYPQWPCPACRGTAYLFRPSPFAAAPNYFTTYGQQQTTYESVPCPNCVGGKVAERRKTKDRRHSDKRA